MTRTEITKHGVTMTVAHPLVGEDSVVALEAKVGGPLPADYREFLLRHNGGKPQPSVFQFARRPKKGSRLRELLSIHDGKMSLERAIYILQDRVPPETLPIGDDAFGNFVLLGLRGDPRGKVYFWDHEEEPDDQPDWSNVELIADSFDGFMSGLKPSA